MNRNLVAVLGLIVGVVVSVIVLQFRAATQEVDFTLKETNGQCVYDFKQDGYVDRGNNLKFRYHNDCSTGVTVAIGNVRTAQNTAYLDCTKATDATAWPFKPADEDLSKRQATVEGLKQGSFVLHGATNAGSYYFSVCIGNKVVDPRLVIE